MVIELAEEVSHEMFMVDCKSGSITPLDVVRESKSGETVETQYGRRYRTSAKSHKLFYDYTYALIASKQCLNQLDEEYDYLLAQKGLRRPCNGASPSIVA